VRVVTTKTTVEGPYEKVRRRVCNSCEYRWYTAQEPEVNIGPYLHWIGDQVKVPEWRADLIETCSSNTADKT